MKLVAGLLLSVLCAAQTRILVDVNLVNVAFLVRDSRGNLVSNLGQDDFEVLEDGVPQKIAFFARSADVPLNLGLVVDFSSSQGSFVKPHHRDLEAFLKSVLGPADRAFLLCFGNYLRLASEYSSSAKNLVGTLQAYEKGERGFPELGPIEERTAGTAFYDSIYHSVTELMAGTERGRKALIIFSDGEDNSSAHHMMEAVEAAQSHDVVLFAIRYTEVKSGRLNARNKYGTSVMERIARETGGADFDARKAGLAANFGQIGEQLRSSYELAYHSTNPVRDGSFHRILIQVKQPGLTVRAKTGYYAR
jgi:Ca-activated chloride channel family protein